MNDNQRGLLWAVVIGVVLLLLASRLLPPAFVVIVALVLVAGAAYGWTRVKERQAEEDAWPERGWDESEDRWGSADAVSAGGTDNDGLDLGTTLDIFAPPLEETEPELAPEPAVDAQRAPSMFESRPNEINLEEEVPATRSIFDDVAVPTEVADLVDEEYVDPDAAVRARSVSIFADDGAIDEHVVDDEAGILAAATASSIVAQSNGAEYDQVLERNDANAETREILSRVANLLEKYE